MVEVYGNIRTKVTVNEVDVLESIKNRLLKDSNAWVKEKDGIPMKIIPMSRVWNDEEEIPRELFDNIRNIDKLIVFLKEQ
tara:strand:+ start:784 stop:1023 length:240 start_codon:yes stop_codon:yes gene_type:complete